MILSLRLANLDLWNHFSYFSTFLPGRKSGSGIVEKTPDVILSPRLANLDLWNHFSYFSTFLLGSEMVEKVVLESSI